MTTLDHVTLRVTDLNASKAFYDAALGALGMTIVLGSEERAFWGWGIGEDPKLEIAQAAAEEPAHRRVHVALRAEDHKTVDVFYEAALAAGGTDNGAPGPRPQYTPTYYAAFVHDPDGNNIEACYYE